MRTIPFIRQLAALMRPEARSYAKGLGALTITDLADATAPLLLAVAINGLEIELGQGAPDPPAILDAIGLDPRGWGIVACVIGYLAIRLIGNLARYPMMIYTAIPSHRIGQRLRRAVAGALLGQSASFYDEQKSGELMSIATSDVAAVRMAAGPAIVLAYDAAVIFTFVILVMASLDQTMTIAALAPIPLIGIIAYKISIAENARFAEVQDDLAKLTERARESFAAARLTQAYAREAHDEARFDALSRRHYGVNMRLARVRAFFESTYNLMMNLSSVSVFAVGVWQVARGQIDLGTFVAFLFLVGYLAGPALTLGWAISLFQRGRASLARIDRLVDAPVEVREPDKPAPAPAETSIEIRDLTYRYPGADTEARPALDQVNLSIPAGATLGVIGPVGAGKSTIARLIARLYDPPPGAIAIGGRDVRDLSLGELRALVALAPQHSYLFSDTVGRNVLLGAPPGAQARPGLELAAVANEIDALDRGERTILGERGVTLSGGQRQRLSIARAVSAEASILMLDDCLSAVDARTEEAILSNLEAIFAGRTGVMISHRVRAVARCDQIAVLDAGRVVERGTHDELMAQGGLYAELAATQGYAPRAAREREAQGGAA